MAVLVALRQEAPLLSVISALCDKDEAHRVDAALQHYVITVSNTSKGLSAR